MVLMKIPRQNASMRMATPHGLSNAASCVHWGCGNRGVCICWLGSEFKFGVPYGSRTRVAAVKEKRPLVIQRNLAAWIALYRT